MKKLLALYLLPVFIVSSFLLIISQSASAVVASDWKAGRIIDDAKFTGLDMTVTDIQNFLNNKVPDCDTWGTQPASEYGRGDITHAQYAASRGWPGPPYVCLKSYHEVPKNAPGPGIPLSSFNNNGNPPAGSISAAQMIFNAAQQYQISPKVLLVKLGTESAGPLTGDRWPLSSQYAYAMGAHCPDSGPGGSANCDSNYAGFSIQMAEAAKLLRGYLNDMTKPWWQYKKPYTTNNILWNVEPSGCGGGNVYIESMGTAALYTYTPYQPNQAALNNMYSTGDRCSAYGNRNFWRVYNDWFGSSIMPQIVRNPGGSIFVLDSGYKFYVPSEAILRDYGTDPGYVPTVSDSYINSIAWGNSIPGQSGNINYLVKTISETDGDGPTLYAVTAGKKYSVISMDQSANFNFNLNEIAYLPETLVASIPSGGNLSNFLQSPTNNAFYVNNGQKNIILESPKYLALNPSNKATFASYFFVNRLTSGNPLTDNPILLKYNNGSVVLYGSSKYYPLASMNAYLCWGFADGTAGNLYTLTDDTYVTPTNQTVISSCAVQNIAGDKFLLNKTEKILLTNQNSLVAIPYNNPSIDTILNRLSQNNNLSSYVKSSSTAGIWKIENNTKRIVPSMKNFELLKLNITGISSLNQSTLNTLPDGDPVLGNGLAVKSPESPTVYAIGPNERIAYQSAEQFLAFGNKWNQIETYSTDLLQRLYPNNSKNMQNFIVNTATSQAYLMEESGCYLFNDQMLTEYGTSKQETLVKQNYSADVYANINYNNCVAPSVYIKSPVNAVVYKVINGQKQSFSSWNLLVQDNGGTPPKITVLSTQTINSIN